MIKEFVSRTHFGFSRFLSQATNVNPEHPFSESVWDFHNARMILRILGVSIYCFLSFQDWCDSVAHGDRVCAPTPPEIPGNYVPSEKSITQFLGITRNRSFYEQGDYFDCSAVLGEQLGAQCFSSPNVTIRHHFRLSFWCHFCVLMPLFQKWHQNILYQFLRIFWK